jgi:hypothetical protein
MRQHTEKTKEDRNREKAAKRREESEFVNRIKQEIKDE